VPSAATVRQAEDLVSKLGIASALRRRFARLSEIPKIWEPAPISESRAGSAVFANVRTKEIMAVPTGTSSLELPIQIMTWEKFRDTIMPDVLSMKFFAANVKHNYIGLLTAADPEAKPILQWDSIDARNTVSWFVYNGGSLPGRWELPVGFHKVNAIVEQPTAWNKTDVHQFFHHGDSVIFVLNGARNLGTKNSCIFPEQLRTELHGIRSVIEAYSQSTSPEGAEEADANGVRLDKGQPPIATFNLQCKLRNGATANYQLDRWN